MTPHKVTTTFWDHATLWGDDESLAGHTTDGGRVFGITRTRYIECDHYNCQPVAVVPYEDREQVERLGDIFCKVPSSGWVDQMQDALREFANPKPPKPEEPTGLGAVVEDAEGRRYTRYHATSTTTEPQPWALEIDDDRVEIRYAYPDIDAVRVLSEGVQP